MSESQAPELAAASRAPVRAVRKVRSRLPVFVSFVQAFLIIVHLALYGTLWFFWPGAVQSHATAMFIAMTGLSFSFVVSTMLAYRFFNPLVRVVYTIASFWLGLVNFLVVAAGASWMLYGATWVLGAQIDKQWIAGVCFGLGLFAGIAATVNAAWTRVVRVKVKLPNLPDAWRGRTAAVVSDLHLGHVRNSGFLRRIVRKLSALRPDVLFIPGDLYDGTDVELAPLSEPWRAFSAPLGSYFITGNHEQFSSPTKYLDAVRQSGIRVLENEKVVLDGLQIVGVHYLHSTNAAHFRSVLRQIDIDPAAPSILLVHNPNRLEVAAEAGISLQISGHTHLGQFYPFTWIVHRIYGKFAHGLQQFGEMAVYTSSGVGTWGPPMRLGSNPEIVLLQFE